MGLNQTCYKAYWKVASVLLPGVRYCQYAYEDALRESVCPGISWLDLGCGRAILPEWRRKQEEELLSAAGRIVGIDADIPSLKRNRTLRHRVAGDISSLPFPASSFGLVTANMVVEHLSNPLQQFREVNRVLRPGGSFLFITPNARGYHTLISRSLPERLKKRLIWWLEGRREQDVFPTFYRVNTEAKVREIARESGFTVADLRMVQGGAIPQFVLVPPVLLAEILWIRLLLTRPLRGLRSVIIAWLVKAPDGN